MNQFISGQRVMFRGNPYDFGYIGATGKAILYNVGERNMQDSCAVDLADVEPGQYTCGMCHKTFDKGWSDEAAMKESRQLFGECPPDQMATVCDDCFAKIHPNRN